MGNYNDKFEKKSNLGEITQDEENQTMIEIEGTGVKQIKKCGIQARCKISDEEFAVAKKNGLQEHVINAAIINTAIPHEMLKAT